MIRFAKISANFHANYGDKKTPTQLCIKCLDTHITLIWIKTFTSEENKKSSNLLRIDTIKSCYF